jgi:hypothetical protein
MTWWRCDYAKKKMTSGAVTAEYKTLGPIGRDVVRRRFFDGRPIAWPS